ncbi:hypothetical protein E3P99_03420 [Wallemia hederae]|uniref:Uncharacterized protein n=1 Tax=Wallemia hederae TaxID=1540922 RepID=A0A4V4LSQ5_9BASI|nr:hypothetical protein E3P99_03420 [Wallemia hederae]
MEQIDADALVHLFDFLCRGLADADGDCMLLALCEDGYDGVGWVGFVCWGELAALGRDMTLAPAMRNLIAPLSTVTGGSKWSSWDWKKRGNPLKESSCSWLWHLISDIDSFFGQICSSSAPSFSLSPSNWSSSFCLMALCTDDLIAVEFPICVLSNLANILGFVRDGQKEDAMNKIFKMKDKKYTQYTPYKPSPTAYHPPPSFDGALIGESPSTAPVHVPTHKHHKRSDSLKNLFNPEEIAAIPQPLSRADTLKQRRRSASAPQPSPILETEFEHQQEVSQVLHQTHLLDLERKYWQRLGSKPLARSSNSISRHFSNAQPLNQHSRSTSHDHKQSNHKRIASTSSNKSSLARSQSLSVPTKPLEIHLARSNSKHIHGCGKFLRKAWSFNKENQQPQDLHLRVETNRGNLHIRNQGTDCINVLSEQDKIRIEGGGDGAVYGANDSLTLQPSPSTSQVGLAVTSPSPAPPESSLPVHSGSHTTSTPPIRLPRARSVATFTDDQIPLSQRRIVIPQRSSSKRFSPSTHQSPSKSMIVGSEYTKNKLRRRSTGNSSSRSMSATSSKSMGYDTYLAYHRDDEGEDERGNVEDTITASLNNGSLANHSIASDVATLDHYPAPPASTMPTTLAPAFLDGHTTTGNPHSSHSNTTSHTNSTSSVMEELRDAPLPPKRTGDIMQASRAASQSSVRAVREQATSTSSTPDFPARQHTPPQAPPMHVSVSHTADALDDTSSGSIRGSVRSSKRSKPREPPALTITLPPKEEAPTALQSPFKEPPQAPNNDKTFSKEIDHFLYVRDPSPAPPIPRKSPRRKSPNPSVMSSPYISAPAMAVPSRVANSEYGNSGASSGSGRNTPESGSVRSATASIMNRSRSSSSAVPVVNSAGGRSRSNSAMRPSVEYVQPTGGRAESKPLLALDVETVKNKLRAAKESRAREDNERRERELREVREARAKEDLRRHDEEAKHLARMEAFRRSRVDRNGTYSSQRSQRSVAQVQPAQSAMQSPQPPPQKAHPFAAAAAPDNSSDSASNDAKNINTVGDSLAKRLSSDAYLNNLRLSSQQSPRLTRVTEGGSGGDAPNDLFYKPRLAYAHQHQIPPLAPFNSPASMATRDYTIAHAHTNAHTHANITTHSLPYSPPLNTTTPAAPRYHHQHQQHAPVRPSMSSSGSNSNTNSNSAMSALSSQSGAPVKPKSKTNIKDLEAMLHTLKMRRARQQAEKEDELGGEMDEKLVRDSQQQKVQSGLPTLPHRIHDEDVVDAQHHHSQHSQHLQHLQHPHSHSQQSHLLLNLTASS